LVVVFIELTSFAEELPTTISDPSRDRQLLTRHPDQARLARR
jgi:hypothetical protein